MFQIISIHSKENMYPSPRSNVFHSFQKRMQRQLLSKLLPQKKAHYGKSSVSFFSVIYYEYWQNLHIRRKTEHYDIISWILEIFLMFSNQVLSRWLTVINYCLFLFIINYWLILLVVRLLLLLLLTTIIITNNYASFHLWWKENFLKYQKFWKHYDHDCNVTFE